MYDCGARTMAMMNFATGLRSSSLSPGKKRTCFSNTRMREPDQSWRLDFSTWPDRRQVDRDRWIYKNGPGHGPGHFRHLLRARGHLAPAAVNYANQQAQARRSQE